MNRRTHAIIGATLVLIGIGVVALGYVDQEDAIRYVRDLQDDPGSHMTGTYTLLAMPQPERVPSGETLVANPGYADAVRSLSKWSADGVTYISTRSLTVTSHDNGTTWVYQNVTQVAGHPDVVDNETRTWTLDGTHTVFQIQGFPEGDAEPPRVWGVYDGLLPEPVQPKPSQFRGHLVDAFPDGTPLPDGAWVYWIDHDGYTQGCSSKFLPDEVAAQYDADGDGYADDPIGDATS